MYQSMIVLPILDSPILCMCRTVITRECMKDFTDSTKKYIKWSSWKPAIDILD